MKLSKKGKKRAKKGQKGGKKGAKRGQKGQSSSLSCFKNLLYKNQHFSKIQDYF